jgi:hypothetical protein
VGLGTEMQLSAQSSVAADGAHASTFVAANGVSLAGSRGRAEQSLGCLSRDQTRRPHRVGDLP